jgi:hypothetical protein
MPDHQGYLLPSERRLLLRRFAPVLVLFPELPASAPYPDDGDAIYTMRGSYHPRAVALFLEQGRVRYRRTQGLRNLLLLLKQRSYRDELAKAEDAVGDEEVDEALREWAVEFENEPYYAGLTGDALRQKVRTQLIQQRLAGRVRGFDLPLYYGRNVAFWQDYFRRLDESAPEDRRAVVYGRVVQGRASLQATLRALLEVLQKGPSYGPYDVRRSRIALQYWFHYYYDDWANRHEGDWESITVLLELHPDVIEAGRELAEADLLAGARMQDVAYAVHEDGYRRRWLDVEKTRDGRPIVYVARGSSASYFAWQLQGYPASARVGFIETLLNIPGRLLRGRRILGRRWDAQYSARFTGLDPKNTDWVAADPCPDDRADGDIPNAQERLLPESCRGVRRGPAFTAAGGLDEASYYLETEDLFWLEMVHEYGVQWGEDSLLPGSRGPGGVSRADRDRSRRDIHQLAVVEALIEYALDTLSETRFASEHAIPELDRALRPLRPRSLRKMNCYPRRIRFYVLTMWASILRDHPEAWRGGPGILLRLVLRWILYPGPIKFLRRQPGPEPLLQRNDPMYHIKTLLAQVRRRRYELQHRGSKWDNPFAWVRHICSADTFYYGRAEDRIIPADDLLRYLDCVDVEMSME